LSDFQWEQTSVRSALNGTLVQGRDSVVVPTADYNTAVGYIALLNNTLGTENAAFGPATLQNNTIGDNNTALGSFALNQSVTGDANVAVGRGASYNNVSATNTTALGFQSAFGLGGTYSSQNITAVGYRALYNITGSSNNTTALGFQAGYNNTAGENNLFLGYQAGDSVTTGDNNLVIGYDADLPSITANNQLNIANFIFSNGYDGTGTTVSTGNLGIATNTPYAKLTVWGDGSGNIFEVVTSASSSALTVSETGFGTTTLSGLNINGSATSTSNVGINITAGCFAINGACLASSAGATSIDGLSDAQTQYGSDSLYVGQSSGGTQGTTDNRNVALGESALGAFEDSDANSNTALGFSALSTATSSDFNTAVGDRALQANVNGVGNTAVGASSMIANYSGSDNVALGYLSLDTNITGDANTAIGRSALQAAVASNNTAVGNSALFNSTTGTQNAVLGQGVGFSNVSATSTALVGYRAAYGIGGAYSAQNITALGTEALYNIQDNSDNTTAIGYRAGYNSTAGANNIFLGYQAGDNISTGDNSLIIGYDVDAQSATANNQLVIGNLIFSEGIDGTGTTISTGNIGIGTTSASARFTVEGDGYFAGSTTASWFIATSTTASSTFQGVEVAELRVTGVTACTEVETDANGTIICGTDDGGAGADHSFPFTVAPEFGAGSVSTSTLTAFTSGFVSTASSTVNGLLTTSSLGVGTSSPNQQVSIFNNGADSAIEFSSASGDQYKWSIGQDYSDAGKFKISSSSALGTSDRFVIDGDGNIGIGTADPARTLHLVGASALARIQRQNDSFEPGFDLLRERSGGTDISNGDILGKINFNANTAAGSNVTFGSFIFDTTNITGGSEAGFFAFRDPSDSVVAVIETEGDFGIGTTSPGFKLSVEGDGYFAGSTTASWFIATSTTASSTFQGVETTELRVVGLNSCDTLDTDANGTIICGSDETGGAGGGDAFAWTETPAFGANAVATSTLLGFNAGFVSTASSTISDLSVTNATTTNATTTNLKIVSTFEPTVTDAVSLGSTNFNFSDLFLDSGAVVNFDSGDVTVTHSANTLTITGGITALDTNSTIGNLTLANGSITDSGGSISFGNENLSTTGTLASGALTVTGAAVPNTDDGGALGASGTGWSDLFLASGGVINWNGGDTTLTHSAGLLTLSSDLALADNNWIGLGAAAGRIEFDDLTADEVNILDANVGIGTSAPNWTLQVSSSTPTIALTDANAEVNAKHVLLSNLDGVFRVATSSDDFTASTTALQLDPRGPAVFGIGSSSPWRTLSVTGGFSITGLTSTAAGDAVCITGENDITDAGAASCSGSSERFKENIADLSPGEALNIISQLRPVSFDYKQGWYGANEDPGALGLIAEEVLEVDPRLVDIGKDGLPFTLHFTRFVGLNVQAIQEMNLNLEAIAGNTASSTPQAQAFADTFFSNLFTQITTWLADASNGIGTLFADSIQAKDEICVDGECLTSDDIRTLLDLAANGGTASVGGGQGGAQGGGTSPQSSESTSEDTTPPALIVRGNNPAEVELNSEYSDLGAYIEDSSDNFTIYTYLNGEEVSEVSIDTSTSSTHTVRYEATDQAGNTGFAERTVVVGGGVEVVSEEEDTTSEETSTGTSTPSVIEEEPQVEDTTAPIVTLNGDSTVVVIEGTNYIEQGATATDDVDGDLTDAIVKEGIVDVLTPGSYNITYTVSDAAGNVAEAVRTVVVEEEIVQVEEVVETGTSTPETI